jgi:hypothetical protein
LKVLGHTSRDLKLLLLIEGCTAAILVSANYLPGIFKEPLDGDLFSRFAGTSVLATFLVFEISRAIVYLFENGYARRLVQFVCYWPLVLTFVAFFPVAYLWHGTFDIPYESGWLDVEAAPTPPTKAGPWVSLSEQQILIRHGVFYFTSSSFTREDYAGARPFGRRHWNYPPGGYAVTVVWPQTRFLGFDLTWEHGPFGGFVSVAVPLWLAAVPFLVIVLRRIFRQRRRLGLCVQCSYDLRAHKAGGKCPECGTPVPARTEPAA